MNFYEKIRSLSGKRIESYLEWNDPFYGWSGTYFSKLVEEVSEAACENMENNKIYLENELGDIFRDYMCLLQSLKAEWKIESIDSVLERSYNKFIQRVGEHGKWLSTPWDEIKKIQKEALKKENEEYQKDLFANKK
jgi:NTP pyrophosphatase (non-canonical NTP hydrolase)